MITPHGYKQANKDNHMQIKVKELKRGTDCHVLDNIAGNLICAIAVQRTLGKMPTLNISDELLIAEPHQLYFIMLFILKVYSS